MRELNNYEKELIREDLKLFKNYINKKVLLSKKNKNKYNKICFFIENKSELNGGYGRTRNNSQTGKKEISILEDIMNDDNKRTITCYHELGHALMGLSSYDRKDIYAKVYNYINEIKRLYPYELLEEKSTYLYGIQCLEEYLTETFAQEMLFKCKGIEKNKKQEFTCPSICADYIYESTSESKYGIFETIGDELITKVFGNIDTAFISGLQEEYFESFFKKINDKEIMLILGNLGKIYQSIMFNANNSRGYYRYYYPERVKYFLIETKELVNNIKLQDKNKKRQLLMY